jgi:hypothetical protein
MKIIREKIEPLINSISGLQKKSEWKGIERAYALLKIRKALEESFENIKELEKPSPEIEEFLNKRNSILISYSEKNESGAPKIENNSYVLVEATKKECFDKIKSLEEEHKKDIDKENEKRKDFIKFLKGEEEINAPYIDISIIPQDVLPEDLWALKDVIEDSLMQS